MKNELSDILDILLSPLSSEIKEVIIKLTYQTKCKDLLLDIVSFVDIKNKIITGYASYYTSTHDYSRDIWIYNDLLGFTNNNIGLIFTFNSDFYKIFRRNITIRNNIKYTTGSSILDVLCKNTASMNINIILGLLTPDERIQFLKT